MIFYAKQCLFYDWFIMADKQTFCQIYTSERQIDINI